MKKIVYMFLAVTTLAFSYDNSLTLKERRALEKEFKLYNVRYENNAYSLKNTLAKREIVIDKKLKDLPNTSKTAFGDNKYNDIYNWKVTKERDGIQYFAVTGTSRRKAIAKVDGRYVVLFYNAVGKNEDMVKDTIEDVKKALVNN